MNIKKWSSLLLGILLLFSTAACGSKPLTWQEQYDLGVRYLSEGNYEEAIIAFTAAIEIDPKQAPAYVGRGDTYIGLGQTEENLVAAQADYELAVELDETCAEAYLGLANVYFQMGEYEKAVEILQLGLIKTNSNPSINSFLEDLQNDFVENMVAAGDYGFMFSDQVVTLQDWLVNGKSITECSLEDFRAEFPDETGYGAHYENGVISSYGPTRWIEDHVSGGGNVSVSFENGEVFWVHFYGQNQVNTCHFYLQTNFCGIRTNDTFSDILRKIGFTEIGIAYLSACEENITYMTDEFEMHFMKNEDGYQSIGFGFSTFENGIRTDRKVLSFSFFGEELGEIYYQIQGTR